MVREATAERRAAEQNHGTITARRGLGRPRRHKAAALVTRTEQGLGAVEGAAAVERGEDGVSRGRARRATASISGVHRSSVVQRRRAAAVTIRCTPLPSRPNLSLLSLAAAVVVALFAMPLLSRPRSSPVRVEVAERKGNKGSAAAPAGDEDDGREKRV